jgi:hypothetical protein
MRSACEPRIAASTSSEAAHYAAHAHDARRFVDIPVQRLADGAQHARRGLVEAACPGENQRGVVLRARVLRHLRVRLHHLGHQRVALDRRV